MSIRKQLLRLYWAIQRKIIPTLKNSQYLYEDTLTSYIHSTLVWLDLGCGHNLLPPWRSDKEKELTTSCKMLVGLDYDMISLKKHTTIHYKMRGDSSSLPFQDNTFDLVTSNMVLEHFNNVEMQFQEISRILKPKGVFIFHTPNARGYTTFLAHLVPESLKNFIVYILQGREEEDIFPAYYKINSESRIREVAQFTGFRIKDIQMVVSSAQLAMIPPLVIVELLWIKLLMTKPFKHLRTNIIAILEKDENIQGEASIQ